MKTRNIIYCIGVLALIGCSKGKTVYVDNVVVDNSVADVFAADKKPADKKPIETNEIQDELLTTFGKAFKDTIEAFSMKFGVTYDKGFLQYSCGQVSGFSATEIEIFRQQIAALTEHLVNPVFKGKNVMFLCSRSKNIGINEESSKKKIYDPKIIKSEAVEDKASTSIIWLSTDTSVAAEDFVSQYARPEQTELALLERKRVLKEVSISHFNQQLGPQFMKFHENFIKLLADGSVKGSEGAVDALIQTHFPNHQLIKADWDQFSLWFIFQTNYIQLIFGSEESIYDYKISLGDFNLTFDIYQTNGQKGRVVEMLIKEGKRFGYNNTPLSKQNLLTYGSLLSDSGQGTLTRFQRDTTGRILSVTESDCLYAPADTKQNSTQLEHSKKVATCRTRVENLSAPYQELPVTAASYLSNEDLAFDSQHTPSARVVVGLIGAGVDYNNPLVNQRLLRNNLSFEYYNEPYPQELPLESRFMDNPLQSKDGLLLGSAMAVLSSFGSKQIKVVPVKIDSNKTNFEMIFTFLESKGASIVVFSPSIFQDVIQQLKATIDLMKEIKKHPKLLVVADAGKNLGNLNKSMTDWRCESLANCISITASRANQLTIEEDANSGNKVVELAVYGSHFETLRSFSYKIDEYSGRGVNPKEFAGSFAAAKVANYLARKILKSETTLENAKDFLLSKAMSAPALEAFVRNGKVLPKAELEYFDLSKGIRL